MVQSNKEINVTNSVSVNLTIYKKNRLLNLKNNGKLFFNSPSWIGLMKINFSMAKKKRPPNVIYIHSLAQRLFYTFIPALKWQ